MPKPEYGGASYYGDEFVGRNTSSGERYNHLKYTCAHKKLRFGTILKVTNLQKNKVVFVKVNDRGPFIKGRVVDLSKRAAEEIDMIQYGHSQVKVEVVGHTDTVPITSFSHLFSPEALNDSILKANKYYNLSGDELKVTKAYGLEYNRFATFKELQDFALANCTDLFLEYTIFKKEVTTDTIPPAYVLYLGSELYDTKPLNKVRAKLLDMGYKPKQVRYN